MWGGDVGCVGDPVVCNFVYCVIADCCDHVCMEFKNVE